ncbi:MAG: CPBP family intramembrane metalloprotease [Clostridia bacterium]|nr:CPBP family intramembrane metalloprotease [Clostridia bacterium]
MNKNKIAEIVKFHVEKNLHTKGFIIFNIIMCLITIFAVNINNIDKVLEQNDINLFEEEYSLEILDSNNLVEGKFEEIYKDNKSIKISYVDKNEYTKENIPDDVILVEFKLNQKDLIETTIVSKEAVDNTVYTNVEEVTKLARSEIFSRKNGISKEELEILNESPNIEEIMLGIDAENSEMKAFIKDFSVVAVYMILILVLSMISNEIAREKVSKSIEYVLTSVTAKEYLLAKVLGVTITIVIQLLYSLVYFLIGNGINTILNISEASTVAQTSIAAIDMSIVNYILAMTGYLIFTVFFMCLIQAALSSKTTSVAEAGNTTTLLVMITIVLYFISLSSIGPYIKVTTPMYIISCIPIVSTFFVPSMMIIGQATGLQIFISFVLLIISMPLVFNACAKKFKDGILDYTTKPSKKKKVKKDRTLKEEQEFLVKASKMKKFGFVIGISLMLWLILQLIGSLIMPGLVNGLFKNVLSEKSIYWLYTGLVSLISLFIPTIFMNSYVETDNRTVKKTHNVEKFLLLGFGAIMVIQYLQQFILEKIGSDYELFSSDLLVNSGDTIMDKILFFVTLAVIPGIFEELFMRKALLNYGKQFGNYFTVIVSSIIFALLHMNLQQGIFAFLMGIVFGYIALKTQNVKLTIILHILNNGLVALGAIFSANKLILTIINGGFLIIGSFGAILLLVTFFKNIKSLRKFEKEQFKEEYKMIFSNYTFDIVLILFIVLTIATENYLRVL